jgi:hypothetical protein
MSYKKKNLWQKDILFYHYFTTIYYQKFVFLCFPKYNVFFNGTFLHTLLYISIYIFSTIIVRDIEVWHFKRIKILKVKEALVPMCPCAPNLFSGDNLLHMTVPLGSKASLITVTMPLLMKYPSVSRAASWTLSTLIIYNTNESLKKDH